MTNFDHRGQILPVVSDFDHQILPVVPSCTRSTIPSLTGHLLLFLLPFSMAASAPPSSSPQELLDLFRKRLILHIPGAFSHPVKDLHSSATPLLPAFQFYPFHEAHPSSSDCAGVCTPISPPARSELPLLSGLEWSELSE